MRGAEYVDNCSQILAPRIYLVIEQLIGISEEFICINGRL